MRFLEAVRANQSLARFNSLSHEDQLRLSLAEAYFDAGSQFGGFTTFSVGGQTYTVPVQTTMPGQKAETIANSFEGFVIGGLMNSGPIFGLTMTRLRVFSQGRFQFQQMKDGRPGDLFGNQDLEILEKPWPGGTTSDLLAMMELHSGFAGNCYVAKINGQLVPMRPDWVDIVLGDRRYTDAAGVVGTVGQEKLGYLYWPNGKNSGDDPVAFLPDEVCHFAPIPDPLAWYRGISWLTPIIREIRADSAATSHKLRFFENAATPNLAIKLAISDPVAFDKWKEKFEDQHKGWENAYKTVYLGAGADITVIGKDLAQMDFKVVQGAGETRLAQAAGVPPAVAGLSEGLQGSSLNAGNFSASRRQFVDTTMTHLWGNVAGSLEVIVPAPGSARLWIDRRDIPFLREDAKDVAEIQQQEAQTIRQLVDAGFEPPTVIAAVKSNDWSLLEHTGLFSVQLQEPGVTKNGKLPADENLPPPVIPGTPQASAKPEPAADNPSQGPTGGPQQ